eukprot:scaffold17514_cov64-Phaeocystis_antarctica.AAC.5
MRNRTWARAQTSPPFRAFLSEGVAKSSPCSKSASPSSPAATLKGAQGCTAAARKGGLMNQPGRRAGRARAVCRRSYGLAL